MLSDTVVDTEGETAEHRPVTRHEHEAGVEAGLEEAVEPARPPAGAPARGPLDATRVVALQRGAGNAAVSRLLVARQGPGVAAPPGPAAFAWRDATLGGHVDGATSSSDIYAYVTGLAAAARQTAFEDLQNARSDYRGRRVFPDRIQKIDEVLQRLNRDIATGQAPGVTAPVGGWPAGGVPASVTAGTHAPTAAEQDRLRDAMAPPRRTTSGGAPAPFRSRIPSETDAYEQRIYRALHATIDGLWRSQVQNKGPAEHADPARVNPWSRYEQIADVAKAETDTVFGAYARGPSMRHGATVHSGNLRDRFEVEQSSQAGQTPAQRRRLAEQLVEYFLQSEETIETINREHDAIPERTTVSPGETRSEAQILRGAVVTMAAARERELMEIDRGWDATAGGGIVSLQRWRRSTPAGQRHHFWDMMQTLIHEYLHTLTAPAYSAHARSQPGGDAGLQFNTLIEGMTSALTEIVWANVESRVAALGPQVEGPDFVDASTTRASVPPVHSRRYPSYSQAMEMISIVGARNVYAAYFLGRVDLIRSSPPSP